MDITINKDEVEKYGNEIIELSEEFNQNTKKVLSLIEAINTAWEGADATKYINTMKEKHIRDLEEISNILKTYGTYLRSVPETYSALDETFASKSIEV